MPGELVLGLDAAALVEEALVGGELDPVRAQVVRVAEREAGRRDRALEPEQPARVQVHLQRDRVGVEAALEQLVDADVLEREHLEVGAEIPDPAGFERARRRRCACPRPPRRGKDRGPRAAPRAAARASGRCPRRSGRPASGAILSVGSGLDERRSRRPQAAARRDLRPRARAGRARLGPADDDAAEGGRRPVRGLGDALRARPRALRLGRDRAAAGRGGAARGGARPRLRRREPDPRHAARLGEGAPRARRARRRLGARGREGARRLARGARGERLLRLPAGAPARARRRAPLGRVHGAGRLALRRLPRRVRARDEDGRGEGRLRRASAGAGGDRARRGRAGRRLLPRGRLPGRDSSRSSSPGSCATSASRRARTGSTRPSTPSPRRSPARTSG